MPNFTFKRGRIRKDESWVITDRQMTGPNGQQINFRDVSIAHFAYTTNHRLAIAQLILKSGTKVIKLQCNAHPNSDSHNVFRDLIWAVLLRLNVEATNVLFLPPTANQIAMRMGQLSALIPLGFALFILRESLQNNSSFGLGMGLFLGGLGAFIIWSFNPGSSEPKTVAETMVHFKTAYRL